MTGETVGEAKWAALRELERMRPGLDKEAVRFQVVSEGERGLLGVGYEPARVIASVDEARPGPRPHEPPPRERERGRCPPARGRRADRHEIGIGCTVGIEESDDEIRVVCYGDELGMLIGRHGQTIDAIQYLVNAILRGRYEERKEAGRRRGRVSRPPAGDARRARRADGGAGVRDRHRVELEPMTAVERKVVHQRLKDIPRSRRRARARSRTASSSCIPRHDDD